MARIRWKSGARCAVCLTFDVDGESLWISRDPSLAHRPIHNSMGAYGPKVGIPRILKMLKRNGAPGTFFIPSWTVEKWPKMTEAIVKAGHEVGHHGHLHEKPYQMADAEREEELIVRALEILRRETGQKITGSRTPSCDPSVHTMALLKKHGLFYHSNLMDDDWPYYHPCGLVELPTKWTLDDFLFFGFSSNPPLGHGIRDAAARYYPEGHRGVGGGRPHDYGINTNRAESTKWVNAQVLVIPMCEETEAVENLDAILTVPGVDVIHVAAGDLGQSMGNPGPEEVRKQMRQVVPKIRAGGKAVGVACSGVVCP